MTNKYFLLITICFMVALSACTDPIDPIVANASTVIKEYLRSPSSFSIVSGKEVWSGKNTEGDSAYIVRIEYDAQNNFGAMIRECMLIAYSIKNDKVEWQKYFAMGECNSDIEIMRSSNFE